MIVDTLGGESQERWTPRPVINAALYRLDNNLEELFLPVLTELFQHSVCPVSLTQTPNAQ